MSMSVDGAGRGNGATARRRGICMAAAAWYIINMLLKESRVGAERACLKRAIHFCEKKKIPQIQLG